MAKRNRQNREKGPIRRMLRMVLGILAALVLAVVFYLSVILGQPQQDEMITADMDQPLLPASSAQQIKGSEGLPLLLQNYPVPALCCVPGTGGTLIEGKCYDTAYEGGFARIMELSYLSPGGIRYTAVSIYPARALDLMGRAGYTLVGEGIGIAGLRTVRMEKSGMVRLHAQGQQALYYVVIPGCEDSVMRETLRPLQLMEQ